MLNLKIKTQNNEINLEKEKGINFKKIIQEENINFIFPCGGLGRCGNCKIKVLKGMEKPNKIDEIKLSKEDIKDGKRLACCLNLNNNMEIELKEIEYNFLD